MDKQQTAPHRVIESVTSNALPRQKPIRSDGRPRAFPTSSLTDAMPPSSKATQPRAAAAAAKGTQEYHEGDEVGESLLNALMEETKTVAKHVSDELKRKSDQRHDGGHDGGEDGAATQPLHKKRKLGHLEGVCDYVPTKAMTGVDEVSTKISATLSGQIYGATSADSFALPPNLDVEIILFDDNGKLKETTPPMALAVRGNTLFWVFCGTRGTENPMDIIVDASFAPVTSRAWHHTAPNVRAQAGMLSLVESYFAIHERNILDLMHERNIQDLVTTGHSLGGGIAQLMHLYLQGEAERKGSDWHKLVGDGLTLRSLSFAAPMTIVNLDRLDLRSSDFLERVGNTSICFVFEMDVVPRGYGCIHFINQVMHGAVPELVADLPVPKVFKWAFGAQRKLADAIESLVDGNKELVRVMTLYRHIGKICFYRSEHDPPEQLVDKGFYFKPAAAAVDGGAGRSKLPLFRSVEYEETSLESLTSMHNFLVGNGAGPGLAFPKPDQA